MWIAIEYQGVGTIEALTIDNQPQNFEVPLIPEGDWIIDSGNIRLTSQSDGSPHVATGNITVGADAILELVDTTLMMPVDSNLNFRVFTDGTKYTQGSKFVLFRQKLFNLRDSTLKKMQNSCVQIGIPSLILM